MTFRPDPLVLKQTLIVSVQAEPYEPLYPPEHIVALCHAVVNGGAQGLRLANTLHIEAVRTEFPNIPIIGITKPLHKPANPDQTVYITPTFSDIRALIKAGATIIATDATQRPRPNGETLENLVSQSKQLFPEILLMADCATLEDASHAETLGFDWVSTTLAGYTCETKGVCPDDQPDFDLLAQITQVCQIPVILEGRVWTPAQITQAFDLGAHAVVVGSAITRPHVITQRFVAAIPSAPQRTIL